NASMAMIELVDFNEVYNVEAKPKKKSRRRGGNKTKADATPKAVEVTEVASAEAEVAVDETPAKEAPKAKAADKEEKKKKK
ncbi:MAG: 50S ribosomal protein L17, partial [Flavobacteriaceae bacterium]